MVVKRDSIVKIKMNAFVCLLFWDLIRIHRLIGHSMFSGIHDEVNPKHMHPSFMQYDTIVLRSGSMQWEMHSNFVAKLQFDGVDGDQSKSINKLDSSTPALSICHSFREFNWNFVQ